MLREAELFVMADTMLVEVLGRIRVDDRGIVVPPPFDADGYATPCPMDALVARHLRDEAGVPAVLAGQATPAAEPLHGVGRGAIGPCAVDPDGGQSAVVRLADAACAAARGVVDGDQPVTVPDGKRRVREHLLRLTLARSFVAHYVAAHLGSTACPLPEELARPLWELTAGDAPAWRAAGYFRAPLPVPELASWRDTFLRTAGHQPHPLGH